MLAQFPISTGLSLITQFRYHDDLLFVSLWHLDEYVAKLKVDQKCLQILTASLNQVGQNSENYLITLREVQGLTDELRKDVS